ncbi:phosphatase PAP2 family protein [Ligilactobacillus sp. WILCCON 0076]|uniref:Phosphatase PAP2 family protein n=1 Tax=Ligilactobacillus ubinensis TaxID=2876789 RepID=A0A9X2JM22_9LACO|nr:phosphatase PAP2 family protein [Ligilactobacillus ubinensis]MCP0887220.1 phosphatase PAP2 family protein [Ligilactobacillus ubinensis]
MYTTRSMNKFRLGLIASYLFSFLVLAFLVKNSNTLISTFDSKIQNVFVPFTTPTTTKIVHFISNLGSPAVSFIFSLFALTFTYIMYSKKEAIWALIVLISGELLVHIIKNLMARPRPSDKLVSATGFSFPSGHTFGTALLVLIAIYLLVPHLHNKTLRISLIIGGLVWIGIIGLTRIYLHDHYPTDVLASLLLVGTIWEIARIYQPQVSNLTHKHFAHFKY